MSVRILIGDALTELRTLPAESVHCCVTSPPYYGLRDYGTAQWEGGDAACDHKKVSPGTASIAKSTLGPNRDGISGQATNGHQQEGFRSACGKCGARRIDQQIGLEPSPDEYVAALVSVFREVRRVLRKDATLWLNIGDSYGSGEVGRHDHKQAAGISPGTAIAGRARIGVGMGQREQRKLRTGMKPKDLIGIPWLLAFALRSDGWYLRQDIIWCLSGGAWVYARTQKGDMPIMVKDLVRLDPRTVRLWNGQKWTQVLGWGRTPDATERLEIVLRSGERIGCTGGHVWPTQRGNVAARDLRIGDTFATCRLPEPDAERWPEYLTEGALWLAGLYLAEGSKGKSSLQIALSADELPWFDRIKRIAEHYGGSAAYTLNGGSLNVRVWGRVLRAIVDTYIGGKIALDKHLKVAAWRLGDAALRHLIQGYLDGDGHHDEGNARYRLGFCRNYALERDLRTAAARLGATITLKPGVAAYQNGEQPNFRGEWRWERGGHWNEKDRGEIVEIRNSRARAFWDIGVEDEPHLFALASGVLTHNSKPNPMPESVTDRCTKAHEYLFLLSKSERYFYDADAIAEPDAGIARPNFDGKRGLLPKSALRGEAGGDAADRMGSDGTRNRRSVWTVATAPYSEAHFATFPPALIEPCILAGCPVAGTVLDPFLGSGTTLMVADKLGRNAIGIELNPQYAAMAERRCREPGFAFGAPSDAPLVTEVA